MKEFEAASGTFVGTRIVHHSVVEVVPLLAIVLWFVTERVGPVTTDPLAIAVVVLGVVLTFVGVRVARRPLPVTGDVTAAYRRRMFVTIGVLNVVYLPAFVVAIVLDVAWPYLVNGTLALVAFVLTAPTRGRLRAEQEDLQRRGSTDDLFGMDGGT